MTNTLQDTDEFLVSRNSQSFTVETQNIMSTLQDTDLLLVNRNSNSFSVTFETLKDDIGGGGSPVVITSAQLSEDNPEDDPRFTSQKFDFNVLCAATSTVPLTYKLRAYVSGNILAPVTTSEITGVGTNTITFADDTGLSLLSAGDSIRQENSAGGDYSTGASVNGLTMRPNTSFANIFDGDQSTGAFYDANAADDGGYYEVVFSPPISCTAVELKGYADVRTTGGNSGGIVMFSINDQTVTYDDNSSGLRTFTQVVSQLESIRITQVVKGTAAFGQGLAYVAVDGVALINGFLPSGTVGSISGNTITLSASSGTWGPASSGHYVIGPEKVQPNAKLYLDIDANGGITHFPTSADPGFKEMVSGSTISEAFQLTFPAVFSDGGTPDDDLPVDTSLSVDLQVINSTNAVQRLAVDHLADQSVTPTSPDGPSATMYGLRFDGDRGTKLERTLALGNTKKWTWSGWSKRTGQTTWQDIFTARSSGSYGKLHWYTGDRLRFYDTANGSAVSFASAETFTNKRWYHIVVAFDSGNSDAAERLKIYVDGTLLTGADPVVLNADTCINSAKLHLFGVDPGGSTSQALQGYLSDCYFVDNQCRQPTAFGKDFEGKWGPLDSAKVITNVGDFGTNGFFLPFNPAATGSSVAATQTEPGVVNNFQRLLDGDLATTIGTSSTTAGAIITGAPSGLVGVGYRSGAGGRSFVINKDTDNVTVTTTATGGDGQIFESTFTGVIQTLHATGGSEFSNLSGISVDGKLLSSFDSIGVDASGKDNNFHDENFAVGNTGQVWSNGLTASGTGFASNRGPELAFDGDVSTSAKGQVGVGEIISFQPDAGVSFTSLLEVMTTSNSHEYAWNGNSVSGADGVWTTVFTGAGTINPSTPLTITTTASVSPTLVGVRLDGIFLINANIQDTVLDTPMLDYSVLTSGDNGNLLANASGAALSWGGTAGTLYYYEDDGEPKTHVGNSMFSTTGGETYNFGQQPFANQYDNSQVWSDGLSLSAGSFNGSPYLVFDGDPATQSQGTVQGSTITWAFSGLTGSVRLYMTNNGTTFKDANNNVLGSIPNFFNGWVELTGNIQDWGGELRIVGNSGVSPSCSMIEVDGKILLDAVNASQQWRSSFTSSNGFDSGKGADKAFDGDPNTYAQPTGALDSSPGVFTTSIEGITSMRVKFKGRLHINDLGEIADEPNDNVWYTLPSPPSTLTKLEVYPHAAGVSGPRLYAIEINNKTLVDTDVAGIPGAVGNELKRTWKEWNNVAFLRMSNPMHVAAFNAVETSIQAYPARAAAHRDDLMSRLATAGVLTEEINATFGN